MDQNLSLYIEKERLHDYAASTARLLRPGLGRADEERSRLFPDGFQSVTVLRRAGISARRKNDFRLYQNLTDYDII